MKKTLLLILMTTVLSGCGESDAEKDYARCNDEYADGTECTQDEFREFLIYEAEDMADAMGVDNPTGDTQSKVLDEIDQKVAQIFE